jgi:hypothetical protein
MSLSSSTHSFAKSRHPLGLGEVDLLPVGDAPPRIVKDTRLAGLVGCARFATRPSAEAVCAALSRCAFEPDRRGRPFPNGVDEFSLPGRYRLLAKESTCAAILVSWLSGNAHDPSAHADDAIILSLESDVAAVVRRADLIADPASLLGIGGAQEVAYAYPKDGRWILESTCHQEIRLYGQNPTIAAS